MFFMNVFQDFRGSMALAMDTQFNPNFRISGNINAIGPAIAWKSGPYNLSSSNTLIINFCSLRGANSGSAIYYNQISITLPSSSTVTAEAVVTALNTNATFSSWFTAELYNGFSQFSISPRDGRLGLKYYFSNNLCCFNLGLNDKAGVKEMLSYFERYTFALAPDFVGCVPQLIELDVGDSVDQAFITQAGLSYSSPQEDWELLGGTVDTFKFYFNTYDGTNRLETSLEAHAGAVEGDLGRLTLYEYDGGSTRITKQSQTPHTLTSTDITNLNP